MSEKSDLHIKYLPICYLTLPYTDAKVDSLCFLVLQLYEDSDSPSVGGTTQGPGHPGCVSPQGFCYRNFGIHFIIIFWKDAVL